MTKLFLLHDHPLCPVPCVSGNHHRPFCISPWLLHISVSRNHFHIVLDVIFVQWFGMKLNVQAFSEVPLLLLLIPSLALSSLFYRFLLSNIKATATTISPRPHPTTTAALSYFKVPSPFL